MSVVMGNGVVTSGNGQGRASDQWQRLSPIAILYFINSFIKFVVDEFIYILPGLAIGYSSLREHLGQGLGLLLLAAVLTLILAGAALSFYFFQYRLSGDHLEIRSGVLARKHLNLPFGRIQNVRLEQPFYYRMTGYACLQLDTAGSNKQEARVVALPLDFAEQLKSEILAHQQETELADAAISDSARNVAAPSGEVVLNRRTVRDLVLHGITSNRVWILLGLAAPFYETIATRLGAWLMSMDIDIKAMFSAGQLAWWQLGLYSLSLVTVLMLVLVSLSILGAIFLFYNFTLSRQGDRYVRQSGLLSKYQVVMRLSRLQMLVCNQDWLDRLFGRCNLKYEQIRNHLEKLSTGALGSRIMVPAVTPAECQQLAADAFPGNRMMSANFMGVNWRYLMRWFVGIGLLLGGGIARQHRDAGSGNQLSLAGPGGDGCGRGGAAALAALGLCPG